MKFFYLMLLKYFLLSEMLFVNAKSFLFEKERKQAEDIRKLLEQREVNKKGGIITVENYSKIRHDNFNLNNTFSADILSNNDSSIMDHDLHINDTDFNSSTQIHPLTGSYLPMQNDSQSESISEIDKINEANHNNNNISITSEEETRIRDLYYSFIGHHTYQNSIIRSIFESYSGFMMKNVLNFYITLKKYKLAFEKQHKNLKDYIMFIKPCVLVNNDVNTGLSTKYLEMTMIIMEYQQKIQRLFDLISQEYLERYIFLVNEKIQFFMHNVKEFDGGISNAKIASSFCPKLFSKNLLIYGMILIFLKQKMRRKR